jgi:hypothetical protein
MLRRTTIAGACAVAVLAAACSEPAGLNQRNSDQRTLTAPLFQTATLQAGITLDQENGTLRESGTMLIKGFNPTNPHRGDAIVATFYWIGSTNIIDSVTDVLTTAPVYQPVGNKYTLVEYVTAGGISMATYVATNVQNFPDPNVGDIVLAVRANLSQPVIDGGVKISAWSGVDAVSALPVGSHRSASGSGSTPTLVAPGAVAIGAGSLAYAVTMSDGVVTSEPPSGFTAIGGSGSDNDIREDGRYLVSAGIGTVDPQWTWNFFSPSTWLASVITLNPAPHLVFTAQPRTTLPLMTIPAVQVTVLDALGNRATGYNGQVTIAVGNNGALLTPGTLSGTKTVTAVNGVATFSDLSIDQPGDGYTLVVNATRLTGATSARFNIGAF